MPETIILLAENICSTLFDSDLSNIFLNLSSQARETKIQINKWDYIELKLFAWLRTAKQKDSLQNGDRYLQIIYPMGVSIQSI